MEALVIRKAPVKDIQLHRLHSIQIALYVGKRYETMPGIDQQSTPGKAWLVVNHNDRNAEASRRDPYQLQKGIEPSKHAQRVRRCQLHGCRRDRQMIRLILTQLLHRLARSRSPNREVRLVLDCLAPQRNPCLLRKPVKKALPRPHQTRLRVSLKSHTETSVDRELTLAPLHVRGHRHILERIFLLRVNIARKAQHPGNHQKWKDGHSSTRLWHVGRLPEEHSIWTQGQPAGCSSCAPNSPRSSSPNPLLPEHKRIILDLTELTRMDSLGRGHRPYLNAHLHLRAQRPKLCPPAR